MGNNEIYQKCIDVAMNEYKFHDEFLREAKTDRAITAHQSGRIVAESIANRIKALMNGK